MIENTSFSTILITTKTKQITKTFNMSSTRDIALSDIRTYDSAHFCYLYEAGLDAIINLNPMGLKVLRWIMLNIEFGGNGIIIKQKELADIFKTSAANISLGLKNLIDNNFIEKSDKPYIYVINHNYLFKGDRLKFVNELKKLK